MAFSETSTACQGLPALSFGDGNVTTYAQLDQLANRLSALLAARGISRGDVVGILHAKTPECYACMLACLKLGAPYVNIDDENPPARLAHIFESARPSLVFGSGIRSSVLEALEPTKAIVLDLVDAAVAQALADAPPREPESLYDVTGSDPAYIMFTSGSTGIPKGAIITHANILNFAAWAQERFSIGRNDVLSNVNPMYFDNSVFDFYGALLNGASMVPITPEALADPSRALSMLEDAGCTVWFSVPSLLIYFMTIKALHARRLGSVRTFVFGGEGYPKAELRKLFSLFGGRSTFVNVYGPTECTCICSAHDVRLEDLDDPKGLVTLGKIAPNFASLVLDERDRPVSPGAEGELCLLGPQVGLGYVSDPERTKASFVPNPLNTAWNERMYRTGDIVRLREDGRTLDFVGRRDNQIKHMGHRIELEEIEAALNQIPGITQSAVVQKARRSASKALVAYLATDVEFSEPDLRKQLGTLLPPYMIPQYFEVRKALPKNPNGKVDRQALSAE